MQAFDVHRTRLTRTEEINYNTCSEAFRSLGCRLGSVLFSCCVAVIMITISNSILSLQGEDAVSLVSSFLFGTHVVHVYM